jgi:uncharacterized protein Smg (DUF494 family)
MINALRYSKELEEAGFSKEEANVTLKIWMEIMDSKFATKQDIQLSELALRSEIRQIYSKLDANDTSIRSDMKQLEDKLTIRLTRNMVVIAGLIIAAIKLL